MKTRLEIITGMLILSLFVSIGMTFAVISWMREYDILEEKLIVVQMEAEVYKQSAAIIETVESEELAVSASTEIHKPITSRETIERFIQNKLPGMKQYLEEFIQYSEHYQVDSGFALATVILETGWLKSKVWMKNNNPAGLTCTYGYCKYSTKEQGLERMFIRMSQYVNGEVKWIGNRKTVNEIRSKWSETEDTDLVVELWNLILKEGE